MSHLLDLPNELLTMVFSSLPNLETVTRLRCTNKRLDGIWILSREKIAISVLSNELPGFDEALTFAIADQTHSFEQYDDNLQELVPSLIRNAKLCAAVCAEWRDAYASNIFVRQPTRPWDSEMVAIYYYKSRQAALAFDQPQLRLPIRKRLKAASYDELLEHQAFIMWWTQECVVLRDVHDMGRTEAQCESHPSMTDFDMMMAKPEKWYFAAETVNIMALRHLNPNRPLGESGLWSNIAGYGYQEEWW